MRSANRLKPNQKSLTPNLSSIDCKGAKLRVLQRLVIDHVQKIVATIPDTNTFLLIFINSLWLKPRASSSSHLAD